MKRLTFLLIGLLLLPGTLRAQTALPAATQQCLAQITSRVLQQHRVYRSQLYGVTEASLEPEGAVRYDVDGRAWMKTAQNRWVSDDTTDVLSNARINETTEWAGMNELQPDESRRQSLQGIFQTPRVLTTDLLPDVIDSYRALHCRLAMVCQSVYAGAQGQTTIEIVTDGCTPLKTAPLSACGFGNTTSATEGTVVDASADALVRTHCIPLTEQLLADEAQTLKVAVAYDAATRSLLQFAGTFDAFTESWKDDVVSPLRQTVSLLHQLSRIPCFLAQCTNE